jgi:hypothetical protein
LDREVGLYETLELGFVDRTALVELVELNTDFAGCTVYVVVGFAFCSHELGLFLRAVWGWASGIKAALEGFCSGAE